MNGEARTEMDESLRRERETTLRLLVESVHDYAIYLLDLEGRIASWNPGAQRLKGYTAQEVLGKPFSIFYTEEERKAGIPQEELAKATREGRSVRSGVRVRKDGTRFEAHAVITAVRDEKGVLKGFGKVTRDVSEFEALKKADRTKDEFVALVSHDLRNPLSVIGMAAASLVRHAKDESVLRNAQRIQRAVDGMTHLVRDFLDVASIADGRLPIEARLCEASVLVRDAVDAIAPLATEKGLWVQAQPPAEGTRVLCDKDRVLQVLGNLIGNAIKYSRKGTTITVRAEPADGMVRFSVTDAGRGIEAGQLSHIFDRFFQTNPNRDGKGLGLYIAKGIIEAHGGRIWAESMVGQGSTFYFTLLSSPPG